MAILNFFSFPISATFISLLFKSSSSVFWSGLSITTSCVPMPFILSYRTLVSCSITPSPVKARYLSGTLAKSIPANRVRFCSEP
uniref:Putative galactose-1-phosphate uridylyltransferase n=1 Tax=uncultured marine Nitrospinaceae bacterium TaxID=482920 RepID=A4GIZ8_9BACT|nr:putative galactose-1-phosphate uridylyltransferase [uncultured marine Nitrospinaceae bacterium]